MITQSLAGLPGFLAYFCTAFVITIGYLLVYMWITPHDEFELIRKNVPGAAIALGLSSDRLRAAGGKRDCPCPKSSGVRDLERRCPNRAGRRVLCGPHPDPQSAATHRRWGPRRCHLARHRIARWRNPECGLDFLLTRSMKRSTKVSLVLMGAVGVGGIAMRYRLVARQIKAPLRPIKPVRRMVLTAAGAITASFPAPPVIRARRRPPVRPHRPVAAASERSVECSRRSEVDHADATYSGRRTCGLAPAC